MRRSWFVDVTLRLPGRGLSVTNPVSAVLWASLEIVEGEQPICVQFGAHTVLQLAYPLLHGADCYSASAYFQYETVYQNFFLAWDLFARYECYTHENRKGRSSMNRFTQTKACVSDQYAKKTYLD
jgi:hypothetical protein